MLKDEVLNLQNRRETK